MAQIQAVSPSEWNQARAQLLKEEEALLTQLDAVVAKRQQLPAVKIQDPARFTFETTDGTTRSLLDCFEGRRQLIIYNFMLYDDVADPCVWCSFNMDNIPPELGHLHSRETSFIVTAPASFDKVKAAKERMGWTFPFYSSKNTLANAGAVGEELSWKTGNDYVGYQVLLKDGDDIYHTYCATDRVPEMAVPTMGLLDMTKLGRQEDGKDRPFPLHDQYKA